MKKFNIKEWLKKQKNTSKEDKYSILNEEDGSQKLKVEVKISDLIDEKGNIITEQHSTPDDSYGATVAASDGAGWWHRMGFANGINGEGYLYKCDNGELTTYYFSNLAIKIVTKSK